MSTPLVPASKKEVAEYNTNQDDTLDAAELNQILIKIRQHCFTHRGVDPGQLFDRWDRDKDGTLDYDEMRCLMYKVQTTSEQEFEQLFAFIDKDNDDVISRDEFCEFVHTKPEKGAVLKEEDTLGMNHPDKQRSMFFKGLQKKRRVSVVGTRWNANDVLDEDELMLIHRKIRAASYTSKGMDIPALFAMWDIDNDGTLTREEFYSAIQKMVPGITQKEYSQLCSLIDPEETGGIDVVMVQTFVDKYQQGEWKRKKVTRGTEEEAPNNATVSNAKWTGGLRPANNKLQSTQLKQHGRKKITAAEMKRLRTKVAAESYTAGGMDVRRIYDRLVPADFVVDMKATIKFLRLALPTLTCMDEINYILSDWGHNRYNDGCLRFNDFLKWAKTKTTKKSRYRTTTFEVKKKHLGKDGIPLSSRFKGHTKGSRYIQDDPMFNDLIPTDLFQNLNASYKRKSTKLDVEKAAADVGIDMDALPDELSSYSDEDDDYFSGGSYQDSDSGNEFVSAKDRETREILDLGTWSNSDGEGPEEEDDIATTGKSGPQGEINTMLGTRKFGGGRFCMPDIPDISLEGQVNFSMGGGMGVNDKEAAAVDYYWDRNIRDGKIREIPIKQKGDDDDSSSDDDESNLESKLPAYARPRVANNMGRDDFASQLASIQQANQSKTSMININVVSEPDVAHTGKMNLNNNPQQYGLFGKTARRLGALEDLVDPGTWNFTAGNALGTAKNQGSGSGAIEGEAEMPDDMYGGKYKDPRAPNALPIFDQQQQRMEQANAPPIHSHTMINHAPREKIERQKSTMPADYTRLSQPKLTLTPTKPARMSPNKRRPNDGRQYRQPSPRVAYFPAADSSSDDYSAPPSPRSDRSISSARTRDPGQVQRTRSKSTAKWDAKQRKFIQVMT